jgi:hypothetical protein
MNDRKKYSKEFKLDILPASPQIGHLSHAPLVIFLMILGFLKTDRFEDDDVERNQVWPTVDCSILGHQLIHVDKRRFS